MKIGYFTATNVGLSETFIHNLIKGLEKKSGDGRFVHFVGEKNGNDVAKNTSFTSFRLHNRLTKTINEIEERSNLNTRLTIRIKQKWVDFKLANVKKNRLPDVAFIDYGQTAILLDKFLTSAQIPYVVQFHGYDTNSAFNSSVYAAEIKHVFKNASFIIVASHHMKRLLVLKGCSPDKIRIIRYGVDIGNMHPPLSWEERMKRGPSVVFLGRLTQKKNPVALLHAFHHVKRYVPDAKLTIIGDGKLKHEVLKHIDRLQINDSVTLTGSLPQKEAFGLIREHWVYAQHSVVANNGDQEGCAISPAEAAAFELPVVATLHDGIPEYVNDGKSGFLVREFDYIAMGERIVELLTNIELAKKMGKEGRKIISTMNNPVQRINATYELLQLAYQSKRPNARDSRRNLMTTISHSGADA